MEHSVVDSPILKLFSVWAVTLGITSWGEAAAAVATIYTMMLICEWVWKIISKKKEK